MKLLWNFKWGQWENNAAIYHFSNKNFQDLNNLKMATYQEVSTKGPLCRWILSGDSCHTQHFTHRVLTRSIVHGSGFDFQSSLHLPVSSSQTGSCTWKRVSRELTAGKSIPQFQNKRQVTGELGTKWLQSLQTLKNLGSWRAGSDCPKYLSQHARGPSTMARTHTDHFGPPGKEEFVFWVKNRKKKIRQGGMQWTWKSSYINRLTHWKKVLDQPWKKSLLGFS